MNARSRALAAFAVPIQRNAQEHAIAVVDSVELDMRARVTMSLAEGLEDLNPRDEWDGSGCASGVPAGAVEWAADVWIEAFNSALRVIVDQRNAASASGEQFMREHLRELESRRT